MWQFIHIDFNISVPLPMSQESGEWRGRVMRRGYEEEPGEGWRGIEAESPDPFISQKATHSSYVGKLSTS